MLTWFILAPLFHLKKNLQRASGQLKRHLQMIRALLIGDTFHNWLYMECYSHPTAEGFTHSLTVPTSGYRNPAPTLARMSRIGRIKPVGAPFCSGSWDNDKWVLAMQIGRFPKPWAWQWKRKEDRSKWKNSNHSCMQKLQLYFTSMHYPQCYQVILMQFLRPIWSIDHSASSFFLSSYYYRKNNYGSQHVQLRKRLMVWKHYGSVGYLDS